MSKYCSPNMKLLVQTFFCTLLISSVASGKTDKEKILKTKSQVTTEDESLSNEQNIPNFMLEEMKEFNHENSDHGDDSLSPLGPPYPVTGSFFKDRFQLDQWNQTLKQFKAQGGDTVILRAPPIVQRTRTDLATDADFKWCRSDTNGNEGPMCWDEAISELRALGHNVTGFLTYQYEEGFSDGIILCPKYDRKINGSRIYYRIVLPKRPTRSLSPGNSCDIEVGSDVLVLFTSFSGIDPHHLLLQMAHAFNASVFFGLPAAPVNFQTDLMPAYFAWVRRVLGEHKSRFSQLSVQTFGSVESERWKTEKNQTPRVKKSLYDLLAGYYSRDDCNLGDPQSVSGISNIYHQLGQQVKSYRKKFMVSPSINLSKLQHNSTTAQHVEGFTALAKTGLIDIIAVQEGRGEGKGCYYWPHQENLPVANSDPILDKILHYLEPQLKVNVTFAEAFTASNQELFAAFEKVRDQLLPSTQFEFWLYLEAFEYLRDDPCLPLDKAASGMGQLLDRATKERIDRALSVGGARVQKVVSFTWDSDFTCTTKTFQKSLHVEIMSDLNRPIIANCSFHSSHNLSVVLLGFNLEGETQGFMVEWTDTRGRQRSSPVNGYYFELDYGIAHHLVKSLQYVMLWDIPNMVQALAPTGTVNVSAVSAYEPCSFQYDLPYSQRNQ